MQKYIRRPGVISFMFQQTQRIPAKISQAQTFLRSVWAECGGPRYRAEAIAFQNSSFWLMPVRFAA